MPSLAELQSAMRDTALGGDPAPLADVIVADGFRPEQRLSIHRNNTTILLTEALAATYPVIFKLVGDDFFAAVAKLYIRAHPPQSPCLFEYGATFANFLRDLPQAAELPYLGDVANLEWMWNEAFHAANAKPLTSADLVAVAPDDYDDLVLTPHPALRLVQSRYPIQDIWAANQCGVDSDGSETTIDLNEGGQNLAILRPAATVSVSELSPGGLTLAAQLAQGVRLLDAVIAAQHVEAAFEPSTPLAILISAGAFCAFGFYPHA